MNWNTFSIKIRKLIIFASKSTKVPINADRWEELIFYTLKNMGHKYQGGDPKWIVGSHGKGADIWTDSFAISAKAGSVKNDYLTISSFRLTTFDNLEAMQVFIDQTGKNFDFYLCCARTKSRNGTTYQIFFVPGSILQARNMVWTPTKQGWMGKNNNGVVAEIRKKMSNQLWIKIPISLCRLITEVPIHANVLGSALPSILSDRRT